MPKLRAQPVLKDEVASTVPDTEPVEISLEAESVGADAPVTVETTPATQPAKPQDDADDLRKQLEDMKRARETDHARIQEANRQAQEAQRLAAERDRELGQAQTRTQQAEYDAVLNAIGAQQAEADAAQRDLQTAGEAQDWAKVAEAQRRLARAESNLTRLEDGKAAFDARREEKPEARQQRQEPQGDPIHIRIDSMQGLNYEEKQWLKSHPDAISDQRKNNRLSVAYDDAMEAGLQRGTTQYFQFLEERLGYRKAEAKADDPAPEPQRSVQVSAPVSRDVPSAGTGRVSAKTVTLTPAQREAAKISGVSEVDYAKNLVKFETAKRDGNYGERG